jgi:hypothetical protein
MMFFVIEIHPITFFSFCVFRITIKNKSTDDDDDDDNGNDDNNDNFLDKSTACNFQNQLNFTNRLFVSSGRTM